jgi:hypothetical protein
MKSVFQPNTLGTLRTTGMLCWIDWNFWKVYTVNAVGTGEARHFLGIGVRRYCGGGTLEIRATVGAPVRRACSGVTGPVFGRPCR